MARLTRLVRDENYPYAAETDTTVCPDLVDSIKYGEHRSMVGANRRRYWGFASGSGRDMFMEDVARGWFRRNRPKSRDG